MVAVIAGNGLGLLGTSLQQLGMGPGGQAGLGQSGASQYVNVATGNLVLQSRDEDLVAKGFLAGVVRTYNSLGNAGDYMTGNWLVGLARAVGSLTGTVNTAGSTVTRDGGDGEEERFTYDAARGLYTATDKSGAEDTLQWNATTSAWTYVAGGSRDEETYNASGQLTALINGASGASYALHYTGSGSNARLDQVTAGDGEQLKLQYQGSDRLYRLSISQIPPGGGAAVTTYLVTYTYDGQHRLSSVTTDLTPDNTSDSSVFTTTYTYDGNSARVASLTQSDGLVVSYTYAQDGNGVYRVATVTTGTQADGDAQILSFGYDLVARTTTVTDAGGRAWVYAYDADGNLTSVTSPAVNGQYQVTSYAYTADGHVASVTDALGNATAYEYDAHGNRVLARDADGNTTTWTYNTDDQVLTRTVYRTPDPDGSGSGQASDPSTTWYVYGNGSDGHADQLRYVIDADGDVSETQYNSGGQVSLTRSFAAAAYDTSALDPATAPTLSAMNTWASSQDLTSSTRVDYAYDASGRLTGKTAWDQVNASGNGVADAGESITKYVYDAQGLLRQQVTARGASRTVMETTSYSYDGLGRLIGSTDALGHVTTYAWQAGGTLKVTYANGLVHTEVRNSAGELITVTESAAGQTTRTTHYIYDAEGQLRAIQAPDGAITYTFYDAAGRISGTVDATGAVTQYTRDADGNVVETRQYATAVDTSAWLSGGAVTVSTPTDIGAVTTPIAGSSDRIGLSLYDAAGLHVADVDAEGNVITYGYDGAGNLLTVTQYATALSTAQLGTLQGTPGWSSLQGDLASITSAADRVTRSFYDVANRAVATLDAAGYLTTAAYDAAGRVIKTTAYANGLTAAQLAALGSAPSLSAVLADASSSAGDQITRNYYDDRGQLIAQIDADGYLTTTTYDETTHAATSKRYAQALSAAQLQGLTGHETLAVLTGYVAGSTSQASTQQYDADGQLHSSTSVDGTVTTYTYDAAGHLTGTTATPPSGAGAARSTSATWDAFGDELTATDGAGATTTYTYNTRGQRVLTTDALGKTWFFYDADGRMAYAVQGIANGTTLNALGEVTAYAYNALGEVTGTTRYATRLNLTSLGLTTSTSLAALATAVVAIADPTVDATSTYTYTLDGLTASIRDALGYTTANSYDAFGDLTSVQRQLSQAGQAPGTANSTTTTYSYDLRGERIGETDDAGGLNRTTSVSYDAFGRVVSRTDGNGHATTYSYDTLGRQISVSETVQGAVRTAHTEYDAYNRIVSQTDAMDGTTVYQYSADTHTVIVTTPDGVKLTTTRDAYGDTVSVTDNLNDTTHYTYDGDGRLLTVTDALGKVTHDAYDADGHLITNTDANGVVTAFTYDAAGRVLTRVVDHGDSSHLNLTTAYAYDGRGQEVSVTDPKGVITTYAYDADGNTMQVVQDAGTGTLNLTTTYTWDGAGDQLSVTQGAGTPAARTTQYSYDKLGRLTQTVVDPGTGHLNLTTGYAYDANDNLTARTDPDNNVTRYVYDEANEQVYVIDAGGGVTRTWRDADGRTTSVRRYATAIQLGGLGTHPSVAQVAGLVVANNATDAVSYVVYNDDGQQAYAIDPLGHVTETRYDAAGRVSETLAYANALSASTLASLQASLQQGAALSSMAAAISAAGNTDQNAHATLNLYDADGRVQFVVQQDTVNGQLLGIVSEQRYDADGRVIARIAYGTMLVPNSSTSLAAQLSTASVQQTLASATDRHLTQYAYDGAGRLRFTVDATNHVVEQQYDADGNLTKTLTYLNAITVPGTLTLVTVTTAVNASNNAASTRYVSSTYDQAGRLVQTNDSNDSPGVSAAYAYDALGQKTSYTNRDGATWTYTYDKAGRLVTQTSPQVSVSSYTTGNTISTAPAAIVTTYTYDADGNVLTKTEAAGTPAARTVTYTYDSRGNQIRTTYPGGTYASVTYDALGRAVVNRDVDGRYEYKVYDAAGELAYDVDGNGYVTAYAYDAYGNQTGVTRYANALGTTLTGAGQPLGLAQVQQAITATSSDRALTTTYDQLNRKIQVQQTAIAFVGLSGVPGSGNASPATTYAYDAYGDVVTTSVWLSGGTVPVLAATYDYYDALSRKTLEVDPVGYVTTWAYDAQGNVTATTQYAKAISTSGLNVATPPALPSAGNAASGFDRTTTYTYDGIGRKATETDSGDYSSYVSGAQSIATGTRITNWTYDGEGRVTSVTVNGATTTTSYDALGRVLSVTQPAHSVLLSNWQQLLVASPTKDLTWSGLYETSSPVTTFTYDALGNALSSTTTTAGAAGGSQASYSHYDALGRVTSETDAGGTTYTNTYDAAGNLLTTTYTLSGNSGSSTVTTTNTYDAGNQRLSSVTTRGSATDSSTYVKYNAFGEIVAKGDGVVNAYSSTGYELSYQYDNAGNLVAATDPGTGTLHHYSYDLRGDLVVDQWQATGGSSVSNSRVLDLDGRTISLTTPSSTATTGEAQNAVQHAYDRWGNVTGTTDARGYTTTYEYDSQNHLIKQTEPQVLVTAENGTRTWQTPTKEWYYDPNGNVTGVTDENGHTTRNTYDAAGELTATTDAVGAITRYAYDGLGNQVATQTPITGTTSHITWSDVDGSGRVIAQGDFLLSGSVLTKSTQQSYALDQNGNRIRVTDALGQVSYYSYDSQGRLLSSQTPLQHTNGASHIYSYDRNGNKTGETDATGKTQSWSYDYYGRVRTHTDLSGASYTYTYDASSGLLTGETSSWNPATQGQADPGYVPAANGTGTSSEAYTYYADGQVKQVVQKTGTTTTTTTSYQYDAAGNTTDEQVQTWDGAGDAVSTDTTSSWDSHNRLSVVTETDAGTGVMRTAYNYDAAGNRRAVFVQSGYDGSPINTGTSGTPSAPASLPTVTVQPGTPLSMDAAPSFTDPLGFGLTFTAALSDGSALPSWMSMTSSGVLLGAAQAPAGQWTVRITGTDVNGNSASTTVTVVVPVVDPVFKGGLSNQIAAVGQGVNFTEPLATDGNGSAITYAASLSGGGSLPQWLQFNATTGTFTGTPPAGSAGTYTVVVTANTQDGGHAQETFTLTVLSTPPVYNGGLATQTIYPGLPFAFSFPTSLFSAPGGEALSFVAGTVVMEPQGDFPPIPVEEPLPSWMSFSQTDGQVVFFGTPPANTPVGTQLELFVRALNAQGQSGARGEFLTNVEAYTQPAPVYHGLPATQAGVIGGSPLNIPLPSGAFTEADGGALTYAGQVLIPAHDVEVWNSNHTETTSQHVAAQWVALSSVGLSINATTGAITGVPTSLVYVTNQTTSPNLYNHDYNYQIEIIATNGQGGQASGTFQLRNTYAPPSVQNPIANPPAKNPGSGSLVIVQSNTFSDPSGYPLTYGATLSSGAALPSGLTWSGTNLTIGTVASGTYTIKVTATDHAPDGTINSGSTTFQLTINNATPVFADSPVNLTAVKGTAMTAYTAPAATDANGEAITYSATGLPPGISFNASTRTFSGTPTTAGTWTVTYKATDSHSAAATKTFTITVSAPANLPPVYNGGIPASVYLDQTYVRSYTFPDTAFSSPAGEALTYTATGLGSVLSFNAATRTFTAYSILHDREITVTLTATDTQSRSVSVSIEFDVDGTSTDDVVSPPGLSTESEPLATEDLQATQQTQQTEQTSTPNIQSYWFTYDADNRVDVDGGELVDGQIVVTTRTGSVENTYDQAGNVVTQVTNGGPGYGTETQTFSYDARGEQTGSVLISGQVEHKQYDADGRLVADVYTFAPGTKVSVTTGDGTFDLDIGGWVSTATTYYYNADGTVSASFEYGRQDTNWNSVWNRIDNDTLNPDSEKVIPTTLPSQEAAASGAGYGVDGNGNPLLTLRSQVSHWDPDTGRNISGYDAEGNAQIYAYRAKNSQGAWQVTTYQVNYLEKDGYLEQSTTGTSTDPNVLASTTTSLYDAFGRRIDIVSQAAGQSTSQVKAFAYDAEGEILQRRDGTATGSTFTVTANGGYATQHYAYVEGQQIGNVDEAGTINVLSGVTGFSNTSQGSSDYVVQAGDTMQSIAQAVYGDANLWYVVAEANGFDAAGDAPTAGQILKLPQVTTNSNTAETFKPYNPREISGSTTPSLPQAPMPAPSAHSCNTIAQIVVIAAVIVASIYTAGVASQSLVYGASSSVWTAGTGALAGTYGGAGAVAAAIGGAVGDAAGQLVGDAGGIHQGFSWGEVAGAGLGAGITAGLAGEISGGQTLAQLHDVGGIANDARIAGIGAAGAIGGYTGEKLVGQPAHFSWVDIAAAAVSTEATTALGLNSTLAQQWGQGVNATFASNVIGGLVNGAIDSETARLLGGNAANGRQIAVDAFGNALGNAAIAAIKSYQLPAVNVPEVPIDIAPPAGSVVVGDIPQTIAPVGPVQSTQAGSLAAARTAVNGGYAPVEYAPPPGTVTLPGIVVTPNGSYQRATPEEEAAFDRSYELNLGWQKEGPENARVQATRAEQAAANAAFESTYAAWQKQDSLDVLKVAAMGPVGGVLGVAAAASPWVAGALSAYNTYEGGQSIEDGHPLWGAFQIGTGVLGLAGATPGMMNDVGSMLSRLEAPTIGSPAAQAGKLDVGAFVLSAESGSGGRVTGTQWNDYFISKYGSENVTWEWPANRGFVYDADTTGPLVEGQYVVRYGPSNGSYVAPLGTDPVTLSMAPGTDLNNFNVYRVIKTISDVRMGPAAPAFDMPGYGMQYDLQPNRVNTLDKYLMLIPKKNWPM